MSVKIVDVDIFPARVILVTDHKSYKRMRKKYTDKDIDLDDCDGISSDFGAYYLVGVFNRDLGVLVHELGHTVLKILNRCNIPVHADGNQEAFCYLQQWLFNKLHKSVRRK